MVLISVNCVGGIQNKGKTLIVESLVDVPGFVWVFFPGIFARNCLTCAVNVLHVLSLEGLEWLQKTYLWQ